MSDGDPAREPLWRRWVVNPLLHQLSQGTEPHRIALAIAFGITLGFFPVPGTPTLVSLAVGVALRLNQPVLQVFREITYPLHLATMLLFVKAGEKLFGVPHTHLTLKMIFHKFKAAPLQFIHDYGMLEIYAASVWLLLAPLLLALVYYPSLPLVAGLSNRFRRGRLQGPAHKTGP